MFRVTARFLVLAAMVVGCGQSAENCELEDAHLPELRFCEGPFPLRPDIGAVRASGGAVVYAQQIGTYEASSPEIVLEDPIVAEQTAVSTFQVIDGLGDDIGAQVRVRAFTGYQYTSTPAGQPQCVETARSSALRPCRLGDDLWPRTPDPILILLQPDGDDWFLVRFALVTDGAAVSVGGPVPLDSLR